MAVGTAGIAADIVAAGIVVGIQVVAAENSGMAVVAAFYSSTRAEISTFLLLGSGL